jgi:hypothetical protein
MADISGTKKLLDEINAAVASYDSVLKEHARDILLKQAFGADVGGHNKPPKPGAPADPEPANPAAAFHTLVDKWTPGTDREWALLGAYYFQVVLGNANVTGFQVNKELKQHGTGVSNITKSFEENISQDPALMRQVGKAGKSQQARKTYMVTTSGVAFVKDKLNGKA